MAYILLSCTYSRIMPADALASVTVGRGAGVEAPRTAARPRRPTEGVLYLVLRRAGQRTVLHDCYFQVPLQVLRPLYLDDVGTAYIYLVSPCGGGVGGGGDTVPGGMAGGARARLTTPTATKLSATPGTPARPKLDTTIPACDVL